MAIKYEVKKVVFGFDETQTEKFVAQTKVLGLVEFKKLCEEVQKVSMAPRGVVKMVIDGLIDTLNITPGSYFKNMLGNATVERLVVGKGTVPKDAVVEPGEGGSGSGGGIEDNPLG